MSYEGYDQCICEKGHYFISDCYWTDDKPICPICGSTMTWYNAVDQTNGNDFGYISFNDLKEKFLVQDKEYKTCEHCGHHELVHPEIFRIPTKEETDPLRTYLDGGFYYFVDTDKKVPENGD